MSTVHERCPRCKSEHVDESHSALELVVFLDFYCMDCTARWRRVYQYSHSEKTGW